jgi:hypothetical protein
MRFATSTLAVALCLASAPLFAGDGASSTAPYSRRQLADCMWKRMSASRTVSYNEASKACKDRLRGNKTDAALSNTTLPKNAALPKPVS